MTTRIKSPRKRTRTVKLRTNGKHKIDAASTVNAPVGLTRVLRPQALFRWLGPQLAAITPTYIEQTMIGAMAGSSLQAWSLFDLMLKTWPELLACYQELIESVIRKKLVYEPYCEEDEKPSDSSQEKMKVVATALRRMQPDATRDDSDLEATIRDVLDAWFRGVAVSEIVWQSVDDKQVGTITAPKSTFAVDPTNYGFATDGSLGLRSDKSKDAGVWPYSTTTLNPAPNQLQPFPEHKFLIAMHKASGGSPLGGALLRPLAWWWCAANFSSDWLLNLAQLFGLPFRWVTYDTSATSETISAIDNMLQNMGSNGWARFPIGTTMEMLQTGKEGSDHSPQGELLDRADRYARSLILGQTMTGNHGTTGKGGGQAFGTVEESVKSDRIDAAGKFAVTVINQQLVPSILMLNFGNTDEMPTLKFLEDEVADLTEAQRDKTLADAGLEIGVDYLRKKYDIPEPAEGEDVIGGEKPIPDFGQDFGGGGRTGSPSDATDVSRNSPPSDISAGDLPGHPFRGNQWTQHERGTKEYESQKPHVIASIDRISKAEGMEKLPGEFPGYESHIKEIAIGGPQKRSSVISMRHVANGIEVVHMHKYTDYAGMPDTVVTKDIYHSEAEAHSRIKHWINHASSIKSAGLQSKLLELNAIEDDAVFSRELEALACESVGHPFRGNQWTGGIGGHKTASEISGVTPEDAPLKTFKAYHVTKRENVDGIIKNGFDMSKTKPRWTNDYAVSLSRGQKAATSYFSMRDKPFDSKKYALLEVTGKGRLFSDPSGFKSPIELGVASDPRDYTRKMISKGYDGHDLGGTIYVHNPKSLTNIREVSP